MKGFLTKIDYEHASPLNTYLSVRDDRIYLNDLLGQKIKLVHNGDIRCCHCDAKIKKTYGRGYCYRCVMRLAECDLCIVKPEKCHRAAGTCRNNDWSDRNCMQSHLVYLAYTSHVKVGLTRSLTGLPRWYDQGAVYAIPLVTVPDRLAAGNLEIFLKSMFSDKSQWRKMLLLETPLDEACEQLLEAYHQANKALAPWFLQHQLDRPLGDAKMMQFDYPISCDTFTLDKLGFHDGDVVEGKLLGVKGQYLILDKGVMNVKQFSSYHVECLC